MILFKKNNYLTLRSKVKVQGRSLRYTTHRLMVMHPNTKYHWPIWKDKKVVVRTRFAEKKQKKRKRKKISDYNNMSPFVRKKPPTCPQVTDKLYHIMSYTSPWSRFELTTSVVMCTDCKDIVVRADIHL